MNQGNKLDIWIWRLIGIVILATLIIIGITLLFKLTTGLFEPDKTDDLIVNVAEDPKQIEKWVLGSATFVTGSDYLFIPLISERKEVNARKSKLVQKASSLPYYRSESKNLLFVNAADNSSQWLFKSNDQLIFDIDQFPDSFGRGDKHKNTKVIFYQVFNQDSNADKIINHDDKKSLSISAFDGSDLQEILPEFDKIIAKKPVYPDKVLIVYQNNNVGYSLLFDLNKNKNISNVELSRVSSP